MPEISATASTAHGRTQQFFSLGRAKMGRPFRLSIPKSHQVKLTDKRKREGERDSEKIEIVKRRWCAFFSLLSQRDKRHSDRKTGMRSRCCREFRQIDWHPTGDGQPGNAHSLKTSWRNECARWKHCQPFLFRPATFVRFQAQEKKKKGNDNNQNKTERQREGK